jgi:Eco57I restriction-modification methylase
VNGLVTGGNEELLSKSLVQAIEAHWRALAADLIAQGSVTSLGEAEVTARRQVEQCLFDTLRGDLENVSAEFTLAQVVHMECPRIDVLEAVHQHLLSRQLHQSPGGELQCRTSRHLRRSRGIYYTPDYIAEYLSERCLSGWDTPFPPRVLDPACGCGRFLLASAQYLFRRGHTVTEIARSLHGCDLDEEAVQVARRMLSLALTPHAAKPNDVNAITSSLDENIICGNSLTSSLWENASSSSSHTSFDIILGNPPYRRELGTKALLDEIAQTDFGRRYRAPRMDLWYYFLHRGIELLAPDGRLGFIVGAYWASGTGANRLITTLREAVHVEEIFQLDRLQVFPGVAGHHMMLVLAKPPSANPTTVRLPVFTDVTDARSSVEGRSEVHTFTKTPGELFRQGLLDLEPPAEHLLEHLSRFPALGQLGKIRQGIAENPASVTKPANRRHGEPWQVGEGVFALTQKDLANLDLPSSEQPLIRPYHDLCDLGRYDRADDPSLRLIYSTRQTWTQLDDCPILAAHLAPYRPIMEARRETRQGIRAWWQLHWPREESIWEQPKLLALQMAQRPTFVPAQTPTYVSFSVNVFLPAPGVREHLNYFAALLNSRLLWKWFRHHAKRRGVGLEINGHVLARAPIRQIDFDSPQDTDAHDQLVSLVNRMLELSRRRRIVPHPEIDVEWRDIDHQIDRLVYKLYDLDEDDIAAIEAACQEG